MCSDLNTSFFPYTRLQALYASVARRSMVMRSQFHLLCLDLLIQLSGTQGGTQNDEVEEQFQALSRTKF
jgi:hypothetical protein